MKYTISTDDHESYPKLNSKEFNFHAYISSISNISLLSPEEEQALGERILKGDTEAINILVEHNLRLVIYFAKDYVKAGIDILDLIQDGNLGLLRAAKKFDITKGFRFSTYASGWITQYIRRGIINHENSIRVPCHIYEKLEKIYHIAIKENLFIEDKPDLDRIGVILGYKKEMINEIMNSIKDVTSLDKNVGPNEDTPMGLLIQDSSALLPEDYALNQDRINDVMNSLMVLKDKEREVIMCRYGFYNNRPQSLEEIARKFGVTRERIRQIESGALLKLQTSPVAMNVLSCYR